MTWRGSTDIKDKFFAAIVYIIPLFYGTRFGVFLLPHFPIVETIISWLIAPMLVVHSFLGSFAGLIIFFILYLAVVRNERINHFIRFNAMQAILIDILLVLCGWVMRILVQGLGTNNLIAETLNNVVFLGTLAACFYAIAQSGLGRYAEIPTVSEAAYSQVR